MGLSLGPLVIYSPHAHGSMSVRSTGITPGISEMDDKPAGIINPLSAWSDLKRQNHGVQSFFSISS